MIVLITTETLGTVVAPTVGDGDALGLIVAVAVNVPSGTGVPVATVVPAGIVGVDVATGGAGAVGVCAIP
jgi:hypothetical protein